MNLRSSSLATLALVLVSLLPRAAKGDALPPPTPISCPKGSSVVHDHGGTHCVKNAPTNCPVGWRGVSGGTCALELCAPGADCGGGRACKPVALCAQDTVTNVYGDSDAPIRGPLLGAPPHPQKTRLFLQPCGASNACPEDAKCRGAHVCLPAGAASPAAPPANASPAYSYDLSRDDPPPADYAPPPPGPKRDLPPSDDVQPVAVTETRPPGKSGGCAGCTVAAPSSSAWPLLTALAWVVVLVRRRR